MGKFRAVSLFSNCGAGDVGYSAAGFSFDVIAELVPHRLKVAKANHPNAYGVEGDLRKTWKDVVKHYRRLQGKRELSLLAACPPCQGMSSVNAGRGNMEDADAGSRDERNLLVTVIASVAKALRPKLIVVENVPVFLSRKVRHPRTGLPVSAALLLCTELSKNYQPFAMSGDLVEFGVPQSRKRAFLTFVRKDLPGLSLLKKFNLSPFPRPLPRDQWESVGEALQSLGAPTLDAASAELADGTGFHPLHFVPIWEQRQYEMVAAIPPRTGQGAWENNLCLGCGTTNSVETAAVCGSCGIPLPRPVIFDSREKKWRLIKGFKSSSYHRMRFDSPSPTITTASGHVGSSFTIHPVENRVLSALECAHLQTFPPKFKWGNALKTVGHTNIREMIGEAVPPRFTKLHGLVLAGILRGRIQGGAMARLDDASLRGMNALEKASKEQLKQKSVTAAVV